MGVILHIADAAEWKKASARGDYRADSLSSEGFIHCSLPHQVMEVANRIFRACHDKVLLIIDPEKLTAPLKFEGDDPEQLYPHIYGPLNASAVIEVLGFECNKKGEFSLPSEIAKYQT